MARRLNVALLAAITIAVLVQSSAAQTTHVVGDSLGWLIPPGGSAVYSTWAANNTFSVGDSLVFNFANGSHDVAKVSKADYDACSTTSPISLVTTSPARITLNSTGEHYFICNFTGHCAAGQKLMVNVSAATPSSPAPQPSSSSPSPAPQTRTPSPAPQPSTPSPVSAPSPAPVSATPPTPVSAPSPAPSRSPVNYTVGDSMGWTVPTSGAAAYQTWASNKTFMVGDILVFNYVSGAHDVAEVTSSAYASCNTASPISLNRTAPTVVTLTTSGTHYYICTIPGHCTAGQKLAINVTGSSTATPPSSANPPSSTTPSPSGSTTPSPPGSTTPSPSGSTTPPPPPPPADSSATTVGGLSATILAILLALLY